MIIYSLNGKKIYDSQCKTIRGALEEAVANNIDLTGADFRKANLKGASLDGLKAPKSCFWSANLSCADIAGANLTGSDLRNAALDGACFSHTKLKKADLQGAYFSHTILEDTDMGGARISCISFFDCDLRSIQNLADATFVHWGEDEITLDKTPIVIKRLPQNIILTGDVCIRGTEILDWSDLNDDQQAAYSLLKTTMDILHRTGFGEMQKNPYS